jgi:hypothetical protein
MAITSTLNLSSVSRGIGSLNSGLNRVKTSANNLKKVVLNQNRVKRQAIVGRKSLFSKREESIRRKDQEDILESSGVKGIARRTGSIIAESTKGFLGRLLDFASTLLVGWLLYNLPTILTWIKNLITRIQKLFSTLVGFFSNLINVFIDFGNILSGILYNVTHLDFLDSERKVRGAIDDLGMHFDEMGNQFEDGVKSLSTPLGQMPGEEQVPSTGTDYTTPAGAGSMEGGTNEQKTMSFLISSGLTQAQAAGIAGNIQQESHFDPKADNGSHHGIAQWDKKDRWPRVANYIKSIGKDPNTLEGQLYGVVWEAKARGDWKQIQGTKSSGQSASKWLERFEISGEKPGQRGYENRMTNAAKLEAKYKNYSPQAAQIAQGVTPGGSTSLAKAAQALKGMSSANAAGTSGGRNGCVWAVNQVFKQAGMRPPWGDAIYVPTAEAQMIKAGYIRIKNGQQQPGDLYIVNGQYHIGIVLPNGNIISNSSSQAKFAWEASLAQYESEFRGPGKFYRVPGNTRGGVVGAPMGDTSGLIASANVSPAPGQEQNLQPKRKGQQIMFIDDRQQETSQGGGGGSVSGGQQSTPRMNTGVNSLIKLQMLLDLAYT